MPVIGNYAIESTEVALSANQLRGYRITPSADMRIDTLYFYTRTYDSANFKGVIIQNSDKTIISNGVGDSTSNVNGYGNAGWQPCNYTTKPVLTGGNSYYICFIPDNACTWFYSGGEGADDYYASDNSNSFSSPTDPTDGTFAATVEVSAYADYSLLETEISCILTGSGILSGNAVLISDTEMISATLTGSGVLSGNVVIGPVQLFIREPRVKKQGLIATHVIVKSPTNEASAHITPEPGIATKIERMVKILEGDATACQEVADELIAKWGREQISVTGPIDLTVTLLFKQKVLTVVEKANVNSNLILQRKEHNILDSSTTVVLGDIILSDDELIARILEGIEGYE